MTTRTISATYPAGYTLASRYSEVSITSTGQIGGTGVVLNHFASVANYGVIAASGPGNGVSASAGAWVFNRGTVSGYSGVFAQNASTLVYNLNSISGSGRYGDGVFLAAGGSVVNGLSLNSSADITGQASGVVVGGSAFVTNDGKISGHSGDGVEVLQSGVVNNDRGGYIYGGADGVRVDGAAGQTNNDGDVYGVSAGIDLRGGGIVNNGLHASGAEIDAGEIGVYATGGVATVINDGIVHSYHNAAIELRAGGTVINTGYGYIATNVLNQFGVIISGGGGVVTNGSAGNYGARIESAVYLSGGGDVTNFGKIDGYALTAVYVETGSITNGAAGDTTALIDGTIGVEVAGLATVTNFGTVQGYSSDGVHLSAGGFVTNGSAMDKAALILGYSGVFTPGGAASVVNFGTIQGFGQYGDGVFLVGGGVITNGSARDTQALIEGPNAGVVAGGTATLVNFGTVTGLRGTAVQFSEADDTLAVETGCAFVGAVLGGGGTLDLDSGSGTLTGNLAGGTVTVSGSMAATALQDFNTVEIGSAATFATSGAVTIAAGQSVVDYGSLTLGGKKDAIVNNGVIETHGGTLLATGAVTGAGTASIDGGLLDFASTFSQNIAFLGMSGTLELAKSRSYGGTIAGFSKTGGTSLDLADIGFVGAGEATFKGSKTGGVLTVTDGTHTAHINLTGNYRSATFVASSDGHGGTIVVDSGAKAATVPPPHAFIAGLAGMGSGAAVAIRLAEPPRFVLTPLTSGHPLHEAIA